MKRPFCFLFLLSSLLCTACSSSAALVRHDAHGGQLALRGPYVPAMEHARAAMLEHCNGRFSVQESPDSRSLTYRCATASEGEMARSSVRPAAPATEFAQEN